MQRAFRQTGQRVYGRRVFRLRTALLVLVAVFTFSAPALAQGRTCPPGHEGRSCDDGDSCTTNDV
jgi:hypothetical protein